jgi:hypothetical protein
VDRRAVLCVGVYAALMLSLVTPLYLPLSSGRDDSWVLLALLAAAHVGIGAAIRRPWVFALPVAASVVAFLAGGAEGLAWMAIVIGAPALVGFTAIGRALGGRVGRQGDAIAAGCCAVALLPMAWAAVETARRGPHVPEAVERRLPMELSLGNLCPGAETPPDLERDLRRRADALIGELRRRPAHLVTYTYHYSEGDDERRDITIRELAEEHLKDMESNGPVCDPELERRLRDAM